MEEDDGIYYIPQLISIDLYSEALVTERIPGLRDDRGSTSQ
jgi:hypothetical protein